MGECVNWLNTAGGAFVAWAGHMLIQSSILILILATLDLLLRKRIKAVVRYWIWLLVLAKLLLPPTLASPTSLVSWLGSRLPETNLVSSGAPGGILVGQPPSAVALGQDPRGRGALIASDDATTNRVDDPRGQGFPSRTATLGSQGEKMAPAGGGPLIGQPPSAVNGERMTPEGGGPTQVLPTWQALVLLAWLVAVVLMGVLLIQRAAFVRGLMAQAEEAPDALRALLEQCRRQMAVRGEVGIRLTSLATSPAICGLRRPVILMPESMIQQLETPQLRSVLLHELAHLRRGDLWINLLQTLLQIVYLYHPLFWWANARIRAVREQAVDETVLAALGEEAEEYPRTLLSISKLTFGRPALSLRLLGVVESKKALAARIRLMVTRPFPQNARVGMLSLVAIMIVALVLLPMARGTERGRQGTSSLMDRLQKEEDPELAEMIRTAVENHKGASEKEILDITRRVTQGRAQILLLDTQIEEINRKIEATRGPGETRDGLLRSKKELETKRMVEMANLREAMGIVPRLPFAAQSTANLKAFKLSPPDGAEEVGVNGLELTWRAGDNAKAYNVYLGLNPENLELLGKVEQVGATVSHLKCNTKYYWRVDEFQADGSVVGGHVNAFTTGGLAAWWKLDEESGDIAHDSSGRGNAGTLEGNRKWQPAGGRVGGALEFDGQSSFVRIGNGTPFNVTTAVSVAAWIKVRAFSRPFQTIAAKGESSWRLARDRERDALAFGAGPYQNNCVARGEIRVNDGKWHHVVGVSDAESVSLYVDGVLDQTVAVGGQMRIDNSPVCIGTHPDPNFLARYWPGWIDELCVFTYPLSADEVKALYSGTTPTTLASPPVSSEAKIVLTPLDTRAWLARAERAKSSFRPLATANLNAWVKLQVSEQRLVVLETLKGFSDDWAMARHQVVGLWPEKETLDYLQGRLKDKRSLPIRLHIFSLPELKNAAEDLRQKIFALAREAKAEPDTDVRMDDTMWVSSGESPFYVREGKIRTFYPRPVRRPDGRPNLLTSGLVNPNDLEQHILWRLTVPKNMPLTFRIEYDEASHELATQVANMAKAVAKRVGLTDLVSVAGTLVEPAPENAFLGKWEALGSGVIQSIDIEPGRACQVTMGEGSLKFKAGMIVRGTWTWTVREILLDINDPIHGYAGSPPYLYRASVDEEGNLVVERGEIWPQGRFMPRPPLMFFKKVQ